MSKNSPEFSDIENFLETHNFDYDPVSVEKTVANETENNTLRKNGDEDLKLKGSATLELEALSPDKKLQETEEALEDEAGGSGNSDKDLKKRHALGAVSSAMHLDKKAKMVADSEASVKLHKSQLEEYEVTDKDTEMESLKCTKESLSEALSVEMSDTDSQNRGTSEEPPSND